MFKHQLPCSKLNPPIRGMPNHHNRHNSIKTSTTKTLPLSTKIITQVRHPIQRNKVTSNKTIILSQVTKVTTTKTFKTTRVVTNTLTTATISGAKTTDKLSLSTKWKIRNNNQISTTISNCQSCLISRLKPLTGHKLQLSPHFKISLWTSQLIYLTWVILLTWLKS